MHPCFDGRMSGKRKLPAWFCSPTVRFSRVFPFISHFPFCTIYFPIKRLQEGYGADTGGTEWGQIQRMDTGTGEREEGRGSTSGIPLPSLVLPVAHVSTASATVVPFLPPVVFLFLSLVRFLLPCILLVSLLPPVILSSILSSCSVVILL